MKSRLSFLGKALIAVFLVLNLGALVTGCSNPSSGDPQRYGPKVAGELNGKWIANFGDFFVIDKATKTFVYDDNYDGSMSFEGTIVGQVADDLTLLQSSYGYIDLQITSSGSYGPVVGNYHVIHWRNLTSSSVEEGAAGKWSGGDNDGKEVLEDAIAEYTFENGYFDNMGEYTPVP
jgi:hypothetical protein